MRLEMSPFILRLGHCPKRNLQQVKISEPQIIARVRIPVKRTVLSVSRGPSVWLNFGVFGTDDKLRF
jgi:hypothetical protein